jgi:sterol desaturase/sphingolipid hydroxylase (fatty acid hydroxylase superfamily)
VTIPSLLALVAGLYLIILVRYLVVAGASSLLLHWMQPGRPRPIPARRGDRRRDVRLSLQSGLVFAVTGALLLAAQAGGHTRLYAEPLRYGWWYLGLSYLLVLVLQDAYFYGLHRLCHRRWLYRWCHQGHHHSRRPTPWTSFAFDPAEAVLQALFLVVVVLMLPLHTITLLAILTTMTIWAVVNHLGLERLPIAFPHHWLGRWFIGPAHHAIHHQRHDRHFGLYFTFWDKLLGSEDPGFAATWCVDRSGCAVVLPDSRGGAGYVDETLRAPSL